MRKHIVKMMEMIKAENGAKVEIGPRSFVPRGTG
jgi:hypothetical protein